MKSKSCGHFLNFGSSLYRNLPLVLCMGAWGTAVFSDDTACDVRDDYRTYVGDGLLGPEATDRLLTEWSGTITDPDEGPVFWLALAATQWKCGRLESRVLENALNVIDQGSGLERWAGDPKLLKIRRQVLANLKNQLHLPQPEMKRIPKRFRGHCEWEIGEVIGYQLSTGKWTLFRVIAFHSDKGGTSPICELLDWVGEEIPPFEELAKLPVRRTGPNVLSRRVNELTRFLIGRTSERELPEKRVLRLGIKTEPVQKRPMGGGRNVIWPTGVYLWRHLEESLQRDFDV